ncbi:GntR family transcriptional regulator, partial [Rheinheimera sp.]|uniref:GntR family transcriptional regulator n=1 Tax=Rheinheimera sp. TaxID=1869214 RepID=UPI003AF7660B
ATLPFGRWLHKARWVDTAAWKYAQAFHEQARQVAFPAESASGRLDEQALEGLEGCLRRMEDALRRREVQAYLEANSEFHLTLYRACGNPVLLRLIETLWLQVGPFFNRLFTEADLSLRLNDFHEDALDALRRGDGPAARAAIEQDLAYFGQYLLNLLELEARPRKRHRSGEHA